MREVFGGRVVWHCEYDPADPQQRSARILAHHWPTVPNHGDIAAVDWTAVEPIDVLTAGFPCTDVSLAGRLDGLAPGTRSGIWHHVAEAISTLRPSLVVIENVRGLLSARGVGRDNPTMDDGPSPGELRALGAVLGDLATLGFDAEWILLRASDAGAPHRRERIFILAWPQAA